MDTPMTIFHYDGTQTATAGSLVHLPETAAQRAAIFSRSGPNAFLPTPGNRNRAEFLETPTQRWRVYDSEQLDGPWFEWSRYQLIQPEPIAAAGGVDFDPADFDPADFG